MPDPIVNAVPEPQIPEASPVVDSKPNSENLPSTDPKPELIDFSPLGDSFKELKLSKEIAEKLPEFLKDVTKEDFDMLSDKQMAKLFLTSEKGYRASHSEKFRAEQDKIQAAEAKLKAIEDREKTIANREAELADIEGDAYFYRDPKVKEKIKYANKQVDEERWTKEEAEEYVKPYIDVAKQAYRERKESRSVALDKLMKENAEIGKEVFSEFDPTLASQIVDGFTVNGSDPKSTAQLLRKELDRVYEFIKAKAVADYVKELNIKQPDTPTPTTTKPVPSAIEPNEIDASAERGRVLFGGLFGGK